MKKIFQKPYVYWFILIFVLYSVTNILISGFYKTIPLILIYFKTVNWIKIGISLLLTLIIGFLVALNSVLIYIKYKENKKCIVKDKKSFPNKSTTNWRNINVVDYKGIRSSAIGSAGGLITGVCPLCVTGLFPLIFGFIGVSFSFASLPFQGIEVQFFVFLILLFSTFSIIQKFK